MVSIPAIAHININKVDFGKWKLVIIMSIILNLYPGVMNISVSPVNGRSIPCSSAADSSRRNDVVPTAMMRRPSCLANSSVSAQAFSKAPDL